MRRLAEIAERCREIAWSNEDAINTIDCGNSINVVHRLLRFDLHQHRDVIVDGAVVVRQRAVHIAAVRNRDTANASRWIASRGHRANRLFLGFHKRHQEVVEADIQQALDDDRFVARRTHHRRAVATLQRHKLRHKGGDVVWRVFAIQYQPVKARQAQNFGGKGISQRAPAANQGFSCQ